MFYFVPAWYSQERPWYDTTTPWYRGGGEEFDDTISQLRMFAKTEEPSRLLLLNYRPTLRYFLHRYDLLEIDYWSLFDGIQAIDKPLQKQLDFRDLDWPSGVEFVYNPFLVSVYLAGVLLAIVEFGQDGQLIWIDEFEDGLVVKRYVFDDRGFVSSIIHYQQGESHYQDYLNPLGVCQFREYLLPNRKEVIIQATASYPFCRTSYPSMEEVVKEVLETYLGEETQVAENWIVAAHPYHNELLYQVKGDSKFIVSIYRPREKQSPSLYQVAPSSDLVLVDSVKVKESLLQELGIDALHLSLFDSRLSLGKSQRLKELIVYLLVDHLEQSVLENYLSALFEAMERHEHMVVQLVTYDRNQEARDSVEEYIESLLDKQEVPYLFLEKEDIDKRTMFEPLEEEEPVSRISFSYLDSEMAILQALDQVRLVVDVREEADLYTQIAAISAGIPQINIQESEFVEHMKNGYRISTSSELPEALDYYLEGLSNWNRALVHSVQKIEEYTSGRLMERLVAKVRENDKR